MLRSTAATAASLRGHGLGQASDLLGGLQPPAVQGVLHAVRNLQALGLEVEREQVGAAVEAHLDVAAAVDAHQVRDLPGERVGAEIIALVHR
ncbi:MAG: hypothetical protein U5L11_04815 [Arhodomonas sp.]|nr:hypothetical protein [Arhodomonas sp.]